MHIDVREKLSVFDDGRSPVRVHGTMEFAAAMLDDERPFSQIVGAELLRELRQGMNILVIAPSAATEGE